MSQTSSAAKTAAVAGRRRDFIHFMAVVLPLVLLMFQGDAIVDFSQKLNRDGQYDVLVDLERQKAEQTALRQSNQRATREQYVEFLQTKQREEQLELQIKPLRDAVERRAEYWNFNVGKHWPLSLIVWPLLIMLSWYMIPMGLRRRAFAEAVSSGARTRGILLCLAGAGLFWLGSLGMSEAGRQLVLPENMGAGTYRLPFYLAHANFLVYFSGFVWLAGAGYAFLGRLGLWRLSLPVSAIALLLGVNYWSYNSQWVTWWDIHSQWGHGYFIGFLAALIGYYIMQERQAGHKLANGEFGPDLSLVTLDATGAVVRLQDGSGDVGVSSIWPVRASGLLLVAGGVGLVLLLAGLLLGGGSWGGWFGATLSLVLKRYAVLSGLLAAVSIGLGVWQLVDGNRRADLALRLFGVALVVLSVGFWAITRSGSTPIHYFMHISLIPVFGGLLLVFYGPNVARMMWAPVLFLGLAIPWPERYYLLISAQPQEWAAEVAVKFMALMHSVGLAADSISRAGTKLTIGPNTWDELRVAAECSGLQILFSFVALSVIYAYLEPREPWKRAIIFFSSFPIAIICNFMRVASMAYFYQKGHHGVAEGMTHDMIGFMMLIPAFGMLWVVMRILNGMERLAEVVSGETGSSAAESNPAE